MDQRMTSEIVSAWWVRLRGLYRRHGGCWATARPPAPPCISPPPPFLDISTQPLNNPTTTSTQSTIPTTTSFYLFLLFSLFLIYIFLLLLSKPPTQCVILEHNILEKKSLIFFHVQLQFVLKKKKKEFNFINCNFINSRIKKCFLLTHHVIMR